MAKQMDEWDEKSSAEGMQEKTRGDGEKQKANAIEMLKADHRRVEGLFDKYEQAKRRAEKSKLAQQICLELTIHAELEEEIFYPACREHVDDPLLDEAQVEHDTAKILTAEIAMGTPQSDPFFDAKVTVLGEYMRRHIQEEEKSPDSIFAKALEGGVDTAALGKRMMARRDELMEQFSEELLLPQPKTLHIQLAQEEEVWAEPPGREPRGGRGRESWESRRGEEGRGWEEEERPSPWGGREEEGRRRGEEESRAPRRGGWEERQGGQAQARGREEERGGQSSQHRGWHGDPKRHSEASRRGWEHRR